MKLSEHSSRKILGAVAVLFFIVSLSFLPIVPHSAAATQNVGIIVPLYTYPTDSSWQEVIQAKTANPSVPILAIINPSSGPGSYDSNFASGIQQLSSAGVIVVGYVDTAYGADSIPSVESEINSYHSWYPSISGILFDDMTNVVGYESYYSTLNSYVHSLGMSITVGNPGTTVPTTFIGTLNVLNIYEGGSLPAWSSVLGQDAGYSPSNFAMVAYGVSSVSASYLQSGASYVAWEYVTDATLPNPYDVLPSYFLTEVADLSPIDSSGATTTTTTTTASTSASTTTTTAATVDPTVTVNSAFTNGTQFSGMWTTVQSGSTIIAVGYTPLSFTATSGTQYIVTVSNYGSYTFSNWNTGSTSSSIIISPTQSTTLTAYYQYGSSATTTTTTTANPTVTVNSAFTNGTQFSGMWTTVQSGSTIIATGYTPLSFTATPGTQYTTTVSNYGSYTFSNWNTGSTNPSITITPTQSMTLTAFYQYGTTTTTTTTSATSTTSTTSATSTTSTTSATSTTSTTSATSTTSTTSATSTTSTTSATSTTSTTSATSTTSTTSATSTTSTANPTVTVNSAFTNGTQFSGMWTTVQSGSTIIAVGYTPLSFTATSGTQYIVTVSNYGSYTFSNWNTGSTSSSITIIPTQSMTLTAFYQYGTTTTTTTTSATSSTTQQVQITVDAATLSGTPISGIWTTVTSGGSTVASGYTPFTFTATAGSTYTVTVHNYGKFHFSHWSNGSTNPSITITPGQATTLIAYFK